MHKNSIQAAASGGMHKPYILMTRKDEITTEANKTANKNVFTTGYRLHTYTLTNNQKEDLLNICTY